MARLFQGLTVGAFNSSPVGGETAKYYKQLSRMSKALALSADFSMLMLGGDLKRKEMLSARLGDVLSHLYIASAVLKFYEDNGRQVADLPFVHYSIQRNLYEIGRAFAGFFSNFPNGVVGSILKGMLFPFGLNFPMPSDDISMQISDALLKPSVIRDRLTHLCYIGEGKDDPTGLMEQAFNAVHDAQPTMKKIYQAQKEGKIARKLPLQQTIAKAAGSCGC
ncbi:MAG: DUF1974 domain-containing protein [Rheinheimera sp.]|nr:DUF1974 domain-containing protein [Rheinheimera sp.]